MTDTLNDIDKELWQLALADWKAFIQLMGEDALITAKVHVMRQRGKSINQIAMRLRITKSQVETRLKRQRHFTITQ